MMEVSRFENEDQEAKSEMPCLEMEAILTVFVQQMNLKAYF